MYETGGCAFIYPIYLILPTMHQEKYSMTMTWKSYSDHLKSMMKEMMINNDFSDVTLVTEDKKHINANINILSACSPVFKEILKKDKNSSPLIFLRGIQYSEMDSIMHYIYREYFEERGRKRKQSGATFPHYLFTFGTSYHICCAYDFKFSS